MIKDGRHVQAKLGYQLQKTIREDPEECPEVIEQGMEIAKGVFTNKVCNL
jgi:hypothetical protein